MAEQNASRDSRSTLVAAVVVGAVVVLGALILLVSYLLHSERAIAGTPAPRALFKATVFTLPAHGRACMSLTTLPPNGRILQLELAEVSASSHGTPPIDALLTAPGYRELAHLPGEQPEGEAQLPIRPPRRYMIGTTCLINQGGTAVGIAGSTEPRSISRSELTINGTPMAGDIALTFLGAHAKSRLSRLSEVFEHASNLTDHLIPVWLVWVLALATLFLVPIATVALFYRALQEGERVG
jgi:hypothetical protein